MNFGYRKSHAARSPLISATWLILQLNKLAEVAELADALDSGSSGSNTVWVQVPSPAPLLKAFLCGFERFSLSEIQLKLLVTTNLPQKFITYRRDEATKHPKIKGKLQKTP